MVSEDAAPPSKLILAAIGNDKSHDTNKTEAAGMQPPSIT